MRAREGCATVLGAHKGRVLAMLAAKRRLRVAAVPAPRGAALDRPCAPWRPESVGTEGVPRLRPFGLRPGSNRRLAYGRRTRASRKALLCPYLPRPLLDQTYRHDRRPFRGPYP